MPTVRKATNAAELGGALARARRDAGLTQQQLVDRAGFDRAYLSRLESGLATEQIQRLFLVLRELDLELAICARDDARGER